MSNKFDIPTIAFQKKQKEEKECLLKENIEIIKVLSIKMPLLE